MSAHKAELIKRFVRVERDSMGLLQFGYLWNQDVTAAKEIQMRTLFQRISVDELIELVKKYVPEKLI